MQLFKRLNDRSLWIMEIALVAFLIGVDVLLPHGIAAKIGYILAIWLSIGFSRDRDRMAVLFLCLTGILLGFLQEKLMPEWTTVPIATPTRQVIFLGMVVGAMIGFYLAILHLAKSYRDLQQTNRVLQQSMEDMRDIQQLVSHDMRTPIINIRGFLQIVTEHASPEDGKTQEAIGFISRAADRIDNLSTYLLKRTLADIELVGLSTEEVRRVVNKAVDNLHSYLGGLNMPSIEIGILHGVRTDPDTLQEMIYNLLDNAAKYRDPSRPCRIRIWAEKWEDLTMFCIEDNGTGMPPEVAETIFEPHSRGDHGEDIPGLGLGLYLVRAIARRLGGDVTCVSVPGKGTVFRLALAD